MNKLILACLATAALLSFSACDTVEESHGHPAHTTTTTTEETTIRQPASSTTETQTIRRY